MFAPQPTATEFALAFLLSIHYHRCKFPSKDTGTRTYRTLKLEISLLVTLPLILFPSCSEQFDPRSELEPRLVLFSILSTERTEQYVRVEQNYMPPDYDPIAYKLDEAVGGAVVTINDGRATFRLSDTALTRADTSRYPFPIRSYVLRPFTPVPGESYTVTATTPQHGFVTASVIVPARTVLGAGSLTLAVLDRPAEFDEKAAISFPVILSATTGGYVGRLYVYYDVLKGTEWVEERAEIPMSFLSPSLEDLQYALYPRLTARPTRNLTSVAFDKKLYAKMLSYTADEKYKSQKLIFKWAVFQFTQVDKNLYNYHASVHANRDPHSIRLDEPSYSNVSGGYGVVGAYTLDSLVHVLPENFPYNNK